MLHKCLTALESASFACPSNEAHLVTLKAPGQPASDVPQTSDGTLDGRQGLPTWLVLQAERLGEAAAGMPVDIFTFFFLASFQL